MIGYLKCDTKYHHFDRNSRPGMGAGGSVERCWQGIQSGLTSFGRRRMQNFVLLPTLYHIENVGRNICFYCPLHPLCWSSALSFILHGRWESDRVAQFWCCSRTWRNRETVCVYVCMCVCVCVVISWSSDTWRLKAVG